MDIKLEHRLVKEAMAIYAERLAASFPDDEACAEITFTPGFEKRMERMVRDHKKFYYFWFNTVAKRVASVVLMVILGLAMTTFSVKAWRDSLITFVVEFFETFAVVRTEYEDASVPATITPVEPTYIPEGFLEKSRVEDDVALSIEYYDYSGKQRGEFSYYQTVMDETGININIEEVEYHFVTIQGYEGIIRFRYGKTSLLFATEKYLFSVSGMLDEAEIIKIAESIPIE